MIRHFLSAALAALFVVGGIGGSAARADFVIFIVEKQGLSTNVVSYQSSTNSGVGTFTDGVGNPLSAGATSVKYQGNLGSLNVTMTAATTPSVGNTATDLALSNFSLAITSGPTPAATLDIYLTSTNLAFSPALTGPGAYLASTLSLPTFGGTASFTSYLDTNNLAFDGASYNAGTPTAPSSIPTPAGTYSVVPSIVTLSGKYGQTFIPTASLGSPFALTSMMHLGIPASGSFSFTGVGGSTEAITPEPATLSLWGVGLIAAGVTGIRRRRRMAA